MIVVHGTPEELLQLQLTLETRRDTDTDREWYAKLVQAVRDARTETQR